MPHADLGDTRIHYERRGEGPPVLGVMGFALDSRYWAPMTPAVTAQNEFITFDNRGIGASPITAGPYSIKEMAEDAHAVAIFGEVGQIKERGKRLYKRPGLRFVQFRDAIDQGRFRRAGTGPPFS
jgi:hypothetical protein